MKFRSQPKSSSDDNASYIRLKDGESVIGMFKGEPYEFYQAWPQGGEKQVSATRFQGSGFRFKINFVTKDGVSYVAKVWEQGTSVYQQLSMLNQDYPLETTAVKITRKGSTKDDTAYSILPLPPSQQPNAQNLKLINAATLNKLNPEEEAKPPVKNHAPKKQESFGEPPFDDAPMPEQEYADSVDDLLPF